jgi:peptide deformylase
MSKLTIQTGTDNEVLREKAAPVSAVTKDILKLLKDMKTTMAKENGLGLAAPQVGVHLRVVLVTVGKSVVPMVNPEIIEKSEKTDVCEEGCLSLPGKYFNVERASGVTVKFLDTKGAEQILHLKKMDARVVQHEIDHLNGVLIADY